MWPVLESGPVRIGTSKGTQRGGNIFWRKRSEARGPLGPERGSHGVHRGPSCNYRPGGGGLRGHAHGPGVQESRSPGVQECVFGVGSS